MNLAKMEASEMFYSLSRASIIYGMLLILISMLIFTNTKESYMFVTTLLGVYLIVHGVIDFVGSFAKSNTRKGATLASGIVGFLLGLFVVSAPMFATTFLVTLVVYAIGLGFIFTGIVLLADSIPSAILHIIIGLLMFFFSQEFAVGFAWFIALLLLFAGLVTIVFGATAKGAAREIEQS